MNRIYKLVLGVEVSARSSSGLSMSVRINGITDINIFVQALRMDLTTNRCQAPPGMALNDSHEEAGAEGVPPDVVKHTQ